MTVGRIGARGALALLLGAGLVGCGGGASGRGSPSPVLPEGAAARPAQGEATAAPGPPALTVGEDVTGRERARNATDRRPPPTVFRTIPVHPIAAPPVERFEGGFRARLPSRAPVLTPTVYQDLVVVSGGFRSRQMYAFHKTTGESAWSIGLGDDGPSVAACEDRVCVFNTESCTLFAVRADTGELLWSWYIGDPLMSSPAVADGMVIASYPIRGGGTWPDGEDRPLPEGATHALAAFDLHTGELRWAKWIDADVISAPVVVLGHVYAATFAGTMVQLDQASGEIVAARAAMATSAPSFIDGALYFTRRVNDGEEAFEQIVRSGDGPAPPGDAKPGDPPAPQTAPRRAEYLEEGFQSRTDFAAESLANDAANGFAGGAPAAANAAVALGLIGRATVHGLQEYQGSWVLGAQGSNYTTMGSALIAYDRQSGGERWTVPLPGDLAQQGGALGAPPASAGDALVVATLSGKVLVVDAAGGTVRRELDAQAPLRTQAAVDGGWIYVGSADGQLVALDTGDARLTGWPTWAGNAARTGQRAGR